MYYIPQKKRCAGVCVCALYVSALRLRHQPVGQVGQLRF